MRFWLDMGVDGMRLDAVPYLVEREGTQCANLPETHAILKTIRRELDAGYPDRMLLAEANQWPSDVRAYFGDGDECHMAFHFPLMPRLFMALRQEDRHPISEILYQMPEIPDICQWAIFLRNHDELTLEMVSDDERDYMYQAYAADPQMRVNAGIRRRLAPLMENSRPRIELLTGLLLSLPGTPVLYYGDELGMGDNVYLGDRNGVRTPMQWNADRNGGFSRADPARLYAPLIMDSVYGYRRGQRRGAGPVAAFAARLDAADHRAAPAARRDVRPRHARAPPAGQPAHLRVHPPVRGRRSRSSSSPTCRGRCRPCRSTSRGSRGWCPIEMSGGVDLPRITDAPYFLTLGPFAFYWLRLQREAPSEPRRAAGGRSRSSSNRNSRRCSSVPSGGRFSTEASARCWSAGTCAGFLQRQPWFERRAAPLARVTIRTGERCRTATSPCSSWCSTAGFADGVEPGTSCRSP